MGRLKEISGCHAVVDCDCGAEFDVNGEEWHECRVCGKSYKLSVTFNDLPSEATIRLMKHTPKPPLIREKNGT